MYCYINPHGVPDQLKPVRVSFQGLTSTLPRKNKATNYLASRTGGSDTDHSGLRFGEDDHLRCYIGGFICPARHWPKAT